MRVDRLFGVAVSILALAFIVFGVPSIAGLDEASDAGYYTVGPKFFPYLAGVLCLAFGLIVALRPEESLPAMISWRTPAGRQVLILLAITGGYVVLVPVLGFTFSSILMLAAFLAAFGQRRWAIIVPMCAAGPAGIELLFRRVFGLRLPDGLLDLSPF